MKEQSTPSISTESVSTSTIKSFIKGFGSATVADKLTVLSFMGTAATIIYSAITFLPSLEQRVVTLEAEVKNVEEVKSQTHNLLIAAQRNENLNNEMQNLRNANSELKGKVNILEQIILKSR